MLFTATRLGAERLVEQLGGAGIKATAIHGGLGQSQRERALDAFRKGRYQALVGTDVAARGIHVDNVSMVLQWDLPSDPKDFLHRSGRTARAGAAGLVVVLVPPQHDRSAMRLMEMVDPTGRMIGDAPPPRQRPANAGTRRPMSSNRPGSNGGNRPGSNGGNRPGSNGSSHRGRSHRSGTR
jgi:superfamily II DNA/RNA helicase